MIEYLKAKQLEHKRVMKKAAQDIPLLKKLLRPLKALESKAIEYPVVSWPDDYPKTQKGCDERTDYKNKWPIRELVIKDIVKVTDEIEELEEAVRLAKWQIERIESFLESVGRWTLERN